MELHGSRLRAYITAVFLVTTSIAMPTSAAPSPGTAAVAVSKIHIDNFGRVDSTYYRGGQPKGHDYADLAALGVKTVVNLTGDDADTRESTLARDAGLAYFQIPMTTHQAPAPAQIAEFLKIVNDPVSQPVYVHCVGGRHRTGVMTAIYRLTHDAWTADRAFQEMKQYKFGADFLHPEFKAFVFSYAAALPHAADAPAAAKQGGAAR